MKKLNPFYILGTVLIAASVVLLVMNTRQTQSNQLYVQQVTAQIQQKMPHRTSAVAGQYTDAQMPVFETQSVDYCALLEVPTATAVFPVADSWQESALTPARYRGSVYDGTMIIGGSGAQQQLGFVTQLDLGDKITVVDMLGGEFNYTVSRIDRAIQLDDEKLTSTDSPLTIFCYIAKEKKYVVVRCDS